MGYTIRARQWFIALFVWLVFLFNIERLIHPVDITKYTYVFVALVTIVILLIPGSQRIPFWALTGAPSLLLVLMQVWVGDPVWGAELPVSITEISSVILTGLLARQLNHHLLEFDEVISKIAVNYVGLPVSSFNDEQNIMYNELNRARFHERPLSLVIIKLEANSLKLQLPRMLEAYRNSLINQMAIANVVKILDSNLFDSDVIAQYEDALVVLLPELASEDIDKVLQKIQKVVKRETGFELVVGSANYPDDAATFESLFDFAKEQLPEKDSN